MPDPIAIPLPGPLLPAFTELAARARDGDPHCIPAEPSAASARLSSANPWFAAGRARAWVVPGHARLAGFVEDGRRVEGRAAAFCGFFESTGEAEAAAAVLAAFEAWAIAEGAEAAFGPIDLSTYFDYRLLTGVDGESIEEMIPFPGEPYNPLSYGTAFERAGWEPAARYETRVTSHDERRVYAQRHLGLRSDLVAAGYRFLPMTPAEWMARLEQLHPLADAAFRSNFAYTPLSLELFAVACGEPYIRKTSPVSSMLTLGPDDDVAGVLLVYPHYGPIAMQGAGIERVAVDDLDYATHFPMLAERGPVDLLHKTVAVAPAHRRRGLEHAMIAWSIDAADEAGITVGRWLGATAKADNVSLRAYPDNIAVRHRYTLFGTTLN